MPPITYNESTTLEDLIQTDEYILSQLNNISTIQSDILTLQTEVMQQQIQINDLITSQNTQDVTILQIQNDVIYTLNEIITLNNTTQDHETRITTLENTPPPPSSLSTLTDTLITFPQTDEILKYNGSVWINSSPPNTFPEVIDNSDYV